MGAEEALSGPDAQTPNAQIPDAQAALDTLNARSLGCAACALRRGCLQVVPAQGPASARLLVITDAPGQTDDLSGTLLSGTAGQLFGQVLAAAGIARQEAYLAPLVRCRPPPAGIGAAPLSTCTGLWLRPTLRVLRPQVIVTLGQRATEYLVGHAVALSQVRGRWRYYHQPQGLYSAYHLPMYHPSYLLRQDTRALGGPKSLTWQDIQAVGAVLGGQPPELQGALW